MSSDNDFEEAMRRMGVRRLGNQPAPPQSKSKPGRRTVSKEPDSVLTTTPSSNSTPTTVERVLVATPSADAEELRKLRAENEAIREERDRLNERVQQLSSDLNAIKTIDVQGIETVQGVLQDWRIRGGGELDTWVRGLVELGRLPEFLSYLKVGHSGLLRKLVDETSVFHCGRDSCLPPNGAVPLSVSLEDCEVCGGLEPEDWSAKLSNQLLLMGVRKVVLRGHRVALLKHLAAGMDSRISVRVVGLSVNFAAPDASTWVALWRRSGDDTEHIAADCRVKASSLGQWVTRVVYRLENE